MTDLRKNICANMRATASLGTSQYSPTRQLSSPRTCNVLFLMVCIFLCGITAVTEGCTDSAAGAGRDAGCNLTPYPICLTGYPSTGSGQAALDCGACIDSASGGGMDVGCSGVTPVCYTEYASVGDNVGGGSCYACVDDATDGVDSGCDADAPLCFTGLPNLGYGAAGTSCYVCLDDEYGGDQDSGCNAVLPVCYDGSCYVCIDSASGGDQDYGCNEVPYYVCNTQSASTGSTDSGYSCSLCVDDQAGGGVDSGCNEVIPVCASTYTYTASTGEYYPGDYCYVCVDDASGGDADSGCEADLPVCYTSRPSTATLVPGLSCNYCIDDADGAGVDSGCDGDLPVCITGVPSTASNYAGDSCDVFCRDDAAGGGVDSGCYESYPVCGTGTASTGAGAERGISCEYCIDDQEGGAIDSGCFLGSPICTDDAQRGSLGDNSAGDYCAACVDDGTGNTPDSGCEESESGHLCYDALGNDGDKAPGQWCAACFDDASGPSKDGVCSDDKPMCETLYSSSGDGHWGYGCYECLNDKSGVEPDTGCTAPTPICLPVDGPNDEADYHGGSCRANCNDVRFTGSDNATVAATCAKDVATDALVEINIGNCITSDFDLTEFASALAIQMFYTVPRCAIEVSAELSARVGKRHLLQTDVTVTIALRLHVGDLPSGEELQGLLDSPAFSLFVAEYVEDVLGTVLSIRVLYTGVSMLSSATSDPHFTTTRGDKFDFNGEAGSSYCIVSNKQLQVNAHFMGATISNVLPGGGISRQADTRTWMDQVAVLAGRDRLLVEAEEPAGSHFATSLGAVSVNGKPLLGLMATRKLPSGITISRKKTRVSIKVPELAVIEVEVVRAAFWEAGTGPGKNFLNLQMKQFKPSSDVHGVLGQSFASDAEKSAFSGAASDYLTSSIFATDCSVNRFAPDLGE
eukprot:jgi/Mesvir1/19166/Mv01187-RA.1